GEPDKEDELSSGVDIPVGDLPCNVYVEGRNASSALRDLVFVADTTCAGLQMEDRIRATVVDLDVNLEARPGGQALGEQDEEDPGAFVGLNDNDSDGDETIDLEDSSIPGGDPDMMELWMTASVAPQAAFSSTDTVTLDWTRDGQKVKVYGQDDKTNPLQPGAEFELSELACGVFMEGIEASDSLRDVTCTLQISGKGMQRSDTVKVTVKQLALKQVSFSGDSFHTVRVDTSGSAYDAPHWQDNSEPPDGDVEDDEDNDRMYPVCFTRDTKMKTSVEMVLKPIEAFGSNLKIKGNGPEDLDIPATPATAGDDKATITNTTCQAPFPDCVTRYDTLDIVWSLSTDGGQTWQEVGTSKNETFITRVDPPQDLTLYRTVAWPTQ
ncbi:MAG: hypothetical protein R6X33_18435, partial [Candidatus Brocadiia bacterium]